MASVEDLSKVSRLDDGQILGYNCRMCSFDCTLFSGSISIKDTYNSGVSSLLHTNVFVALLAMLTWNGEPCTYSRYKAMITQCKSVFSATT